MHHRRFDWVVLLTSVFFAASCAGGGCGGCDGMEPIPGGFPSAKRTENAAQVRVTQSGLAELTSDPAALLGDALNVMGIAVDLSLHPGDDPRLEIRPASGASRLDVTARARLMTTMDIPVDIPIVGTCGVKVDTTAGNVDDVQIDAQINLTQDGQAETTRIGVGTVNISRLAGEDIKLTGSVACQLASLAVGTFLNTFTSQITDQIRSAIEEQTCKACPGGNVSECGPFASACTDNVCMKSDNTCLQELGIAGRLRGTALFGGFSPGTTGALDLYEVAGGYATTNANGVALGVLGGMQPGGVARDRCGPPASEPAPVAITPSTYFQGNTRPDDGTPFDVGIGVHKSQLAQFAWAGYDGGLLCLTIGGATVAQLNTDTLALLSRSLGKLVEGNAPMALGLRPQSPPTITLGKNVFTDDGQGNRTLTEPLLDLRFTALEIDFFASIDDQYTRVFTVVADVHLPIGLDTAGTGEIVPVIGDTGNAFTNLSVKNSEAVTETPQELADLFPTLLNLVLPQLSGGLGGFALPTIGNLALEVSDITAVDNDQFLAIYANFAPATQTRTVETTVTLAGVEEPAVEIARNPRMWKGHAAPAVTLDLGTADDLEWSYRIDASNWSAWSTNRRPRIAPQVFWLPGKHRIEVRARERGKPATIDKTPEVLEVVLGTDLAITTSANNANGFHGQPSSEGCACNSTGGAQNAGLLAVLVLFLVLPMRRVLRRARKLGTAVWLAALACLPGCSCGSDEPCGDVECLAGDIPNGGLGRFNSIAADDTRVVVATYDTGLGDLVVGDANDPAAISYVVVDGVPDVTPTHEPSSYRGGIGEAGPNVGAWTSIKLSEGLAKVSYQDREARALKYAYETKRGQWKSMVVDPGSGEDVGQHTSLAIDGSGRPVIAYIAVGIDDGTGHRITELRLARGNVKNPEKDTDWTQLVIAKAAGTCAGLCGSGEACIAGAAATDPETCTALGSGCTGCGDDEVCISGACTAEIAAPTTLTLASGTGLFVSLVTLTDGRLAAAYYDRSRHALVISVETAADSNTFTETVLDQPAHGDRGMWASAVVDGANTVHIAYQDAVGDQLMYTTWNGAAGTPEVVDDGQRPNDRPHNVGAAASIYLSNGSPTIAYHDGLTADVYIATKSGSWTTSAFASGPKVEGISIAATSGPGGAFIAWDHLDAAANPVHSLVVQAR
ncbi:MAG: hypothetical protein SFX73_19825 [Kofleriaceae bacterium]|nr:hypothetical protein [Kofleriaceae bacterium]